MSRRSLRRHVAGLDVGQIDTDPPEFAHDLLDARPVATQLLHLLRFPLSPYLRGVVWRQVKSRPCKVEDVRRPSKLHFDDPGLVLRVDQPRYGASGDGFDSNSPTEAIGIDRESGFRL